MVFVGIKWDQLYKALGTALAHSKHSVSVSSSGGGYDDDDDDDEGEDNDNMVAAAALDSLSSASIKYQLKKS